MVRAGRVVMLLAAVLGALAAVPTVAQGVVVARTELEFPLSVKAGQTGLTGTIVLANDDGGALFAFDAAAKLAPGDATVCNAGDPLPCTGPGIVLTPSCKAAGEAEVCDAMGADPGVFSFAPTATGRGIPCAGRTFTVSAPLPDTGQLTITPQGPNLVLPMFGVECRIDLQFAVLRMPTGDADIELAGTQTLQYAYAQQHAAISDVDDDRAMWLMTVQQGTPSLAAVASAPITLGAGALAATATLGQAASPAGQAVEFRLYGPGDAGCVNAISSTMATLDGAGGATSAPFAPAAPGVYRWRAFYAGDANNLPAASACDAPGSVVTVSAAPPPPPPPPPPIPGATPDGPQILGAAFAQPPRVGQQVFLEIRAQDPKRPISGVQVSFGEPGGLSGISACSVPSLSNSLTPQLLRIPYVFKRPGTHTITITVLSGGCSQASVRTVTTITITVAPRAGARTAAGASPGAAGAASAPKAGACKNSLALPKNTPYSRNQVAAAVLCLVNAERRKRGMKKLVRSTLLGKAATNHSKDMLKRRYFNHVGKGGPTFPARLKRVRYRGATAAENIGYGANFNAQLIVRAWMNSPGHRANILRRNMNFAGLGVVVGLPVTPRLPGTTYTMVFGKTVR